SAKWPSTRPPVRRDATAPKVFFRRRSVYIPHMGRGVGPVLIIDDNDDVRDAVSYVLGANGWDVRGARNGREALDLLHSGPLSCLIVLDLYMPVMDGFEFRAEQMADPALAEIPTILVSATFDPERTGVLTGAAATFRKPFDPDALVSAVKRFHRRG